MPGKKQKLITLLFPLLLTLACIPARESKPARDGYLDLSKAPLNGITDLSGQWEIYWHKLYTPAEFRKAPPPALFGYIELPGSWNGQIIQGRKLPSHGYATLRLRLRLPPPENKKQLAIKIRFCITACRLYANGVLIHQAGVPGASAEETLPEYRTAIKRLPPAENLELLLQISNYYSMNGGLMGTLWVGPEPELQKLHAWNLSLDMLLLGCIIVLTIINLAIFYQNRQDMSPLYFVLFIYLIIPRLVSFGESWVIELLPNISLDNFERLSSAPFALGYCFFSLYVFSMFRKYYPRYLIWVHLNIGMFIFLAVLISPAFYNLYLTTATAYLLLFGLTLNLGVFGLALYHGSRDILLMILGLLLLIITAVYEVDMFQSQSATQPFLPFGILLFVASQTVLLARRFLTAFSRINALTLELAARNQKLTELDRLKDEFLANTSHELRTPLNGIIGLAESLQAGEGRKLTTRGSENLDLIIRSGNRLSRLVDDLLDFTRIKNRDLVLHRSAVDLHSATKLTLELHRPAAELKGLILENQVPADLPPARADEDRLLQILGNLIGNGVKFTKTGKITVSGTLNQTGELEVSVTDTGPGVPAELREGIFQPFEQKDGGHDRRADGLGLGLSITRKLVELHYGTLSISTPAEPGACFTFTLPVWDAKTPLDTQEQSPAPASSPGENVAPSPENRPKVLFVDDDEINLRVGSESLKLSGYEVKTFTSGPLVLEHLQHNPKPALMILDVMMPGMTGYEVCTETRKLYAADNLPVLMLTALNRSQDFTACLNSGANDFLSKPCDRSTLLTRVSNLIRLEAAHREKQDLARDVKAQIYRDLHDHLGGGLYDLKSIATKLQPGEAAEAEDLLELNQTIGASISNLKTALLKNEELSLLQDAYLEGIHYLIQKRYSKGERKLQFEYTEDLHDILNGPQFENFRSELYSVILEICTNDLKYGQEHSVWNISQANSELILKMQAGTLYDAMQQRTGNGTGNIVTRVARLGGRVKTRLKQGTYALEITLPLRGDRLMKNS